MIYGIGTDIVEVSRLESMLARYGNRLASRILSKQESDELPGHPHPARFIAKRFAAKEAFAKAIGTGLRHPVSLQGISVAHDGLGRPVLHFGQALQHYLGQLGIVSHHLSLSDERNMVVAFVVLENIPERP